MTLLPSPLLSDVERALAARGKLLSDRSAYEGESGRAVGTWPLLTLLVAQSLSPEIDLYVASGAAVAVECFICALDLLDDVEDDDRSPTLQSLGMSRTLNVSTALLFLSLKGLLALSQDNDAQTPGARLLSTLVDTALLATSGQHRDLLAEQKSIQDVTDEECIEIAAAKAGALMSLACRLGAMCAGAEPAICELYAQLGLHLGIAHQLDNDAHDLHDELFTASLRPPSDGPLAPTLKNDWRRGKKTLPIILAAQQQHALQESVLSADNKNQAGSPAFQQGIVEAWSVGLLYREQARLYQQEIEMQKAMTPVLHLLLGLD